MDDEETRREFGENVTMTAKQLEDRLKTDQTAAGTSRYSLMSWGHDPLENGTP
ncbi:hypothetical protein M8542_13415 [Amycolatopsis sp. OK19-0408]|uniref:Uncharacterized protein n=1 Tax=Amycolatopsis iheyensis TaxID=2945988 RepID=A0A9X2NAW1_9PSEU|nr:hypothetical protein [Amycolatopsis iheyensis]MCR6483816.1 hypothetical protein [Amycolatopsis iheyensis]